MPTLLYLLLIILVAMIVWYIQDIRMSKATDEAFERGRKLWMEIGMKAATDPFYKKVARSIRPLRPITQPCGICRHFSGCARRGYTVASQRICKDYPCQFDPNPAENALDQMEPTGKEPPYVETFFWPDIKC